MPAGSTPDLKPSSPVPLLAALAGQGGERASNWRMAQVLRQAVALP